MNFVEICVKENDVGRRCGGTFEKVPPRPLKTFEEPKEKATMSVQTLWRDPINCPKGF
jgi:hypothetical protein